ncbi:MAG: L,D-transpeptidase [Spartobacteria bacterium]|nr:L,D-transpeptidase [Spartobacteria bacterium]
MTDIYVKKRQSQKGCLRVAGLLAILLVLGLLWIIASKQAARKREELAAPMPDEQELIEQAAGVDTAEPAPAANEVRETVSAAPSGTGNSRDLLAQGAQLYKDGNFEEARVKFFEALKAARNDNERAAIKKVLGKLHTEMIFTPRRMEEKVDYTLQRGDSLDALAKRFKTNKELIAKSNGVKGSLIREGDRFRILNGTFRIVVDRSDNELEVFLNDRFFKLYKVGTGQYEKTPLGEFEITGRTAQPVWWRPDGKRVPYGDPENLLGTHWLSLNIRGYGLHGTWEPDTIGKHASAGCVRLLNEDIEELYTIIPIGTPVIIKE